MTEHEFLSNIYASNKIIHKVCNIYCENYSRDDLVQDIIYEAWRSIKLWKQNCKFSTWIYSISKNVCISHLRKQKPLIVGLSDYVDSLIYDENILDNLRHIREALSYDAVINNLPEDERCIFIMYLDGLAYKEIEQQTGVDGNALRVKIDRIKKRLSLRYGR